MKEQITETAVIAMMPWVAVIADINPIAIFVASILSSVWLMLQIVWKIKNWNVKK